MEVTKIDYLLVQEKSHIVNIDCKRWSLKERIKINELSGNTSAVYSLRSPQTGKPEIPLVTIHKI